MNTKEKTIRKIMASIKAVEIVNKEIVEDALISEVMSFANVSKRTAQNYIEEARTRLKTLQETLYF